jgi:hypothetical protein
MSSTATDRAVPDPLPMYRSQGPVLLRRRERPGPDVPLRRPRPRPQPVPIGIWAVPTKEAIWVLALLEEAIELRGVPPELMTDNGTPFVAITRSMLSRFQRSLAELRIRHVRTQIDTPWTNGKIEAFWATLQTEVLDREQHSVAHHLGQTVTSSSPSLGTACAAAGAVDRVGQSPPR